MRNAVLVLLLANLLLFAWQAWVVPAPAEDPEALPGRPGPGLRRLPAVAAPAAAGGAAGRSCERFGPFADRAVAVRAAGALRGPDVDVDIESRGGEIWMGHWVQVTGLADRDAADAALARINAAGLGDAYVVSGDDGFRISLGVFRDRDRADRVARIARGAGFEPVTADRFRPGTEIWLAVSYPAGRSPDFAAVGGESTQILRHEPADCPAGPARGGATDD